MLERELEILYSDEHILAINKPSGLLAIPDGFHPENETARSLLEPKFGPLWTVHRLDKGTSGVLLLARDKDTHRSLNDQFANREIHKEYHLATLGIPVNEQWEVRLPLRVNGDRAHRTVIDLLTGKTAITHFSVGRRFDSGYSLLFARPSTGYTHQIRVHIAASGLSVAGDALYKPRPHPAIEVTVKGILHENAVRASRLMLHAYTIEFKHPTRMQNISILAPYPDDFSMFLQEIS